jgi:hypothetical protein
MGVRTVTSQFRSALRSVMVIFLIAITTAFFFRSWSLAFVVTAALTMHEFGHILAAALNGVHWELIVNPLGIGTLTPLTQRQRLSQFQNGWIHLAGPVASLFLALLALSLGGYLNSTVPGSPWARLTNLSALLAVVNVLPFGGVSDGGRFLKRLFVSLPERLRPPTVIGVLLGILSSVWVLSTAGYHAPGQLALLLIGLWLVVHMQFEAGAAEAGGVDAPQPMSLPGALFLLGILLTTLLLSTIIVLTTPFWLTGADLLAMIVGFGRSVVILQQTNSALLLLLATLIMLLFLGRRLRRYLPIFQQKS